MDEEEMQIEQSKRKEYFKLFAMSVTGLLLGYVAAYIHHRFESLHWIDGPNVVTIIFYGVYTIVHWFGYIEKYHRT